jgi:hypothetical protein
MRGKRPVSGIPFVGTWPVETEIVYCERLTGERIEKQDLNQGMDTGTYSSNRLGVDWGPSYRVRREIEQAPPTNKEIDART